jgi:hypothetical protein
LIPPASAYQKIKQRPSFSMNTGSAKNSSMVYSFATAASVLPGLVDARSATPKASPDTFVREFPSGHSRRWKGKSLARAEVQARLVDRRRRNTDHFS